MHLHQIRVRYAETDQMGVAHHAAYVPWLEEARIAAMRDLGISYAELEQRGVLMPVIELSMRYQRSLRFDDTCTMETRLEVLGPSRLCFHSRLRQGERSCAEGSVTVASVNRDGRPVRIPEDLLNALRAGADVCR